MSCRSRIFLTRAQDVGRSGRAPTTKRFYPEGTPYLTLENALHLDLGESLEGGYENRALRFYKRGRVSSLDRTRRVRFPAQSGEFLSSLDQHKVACGSVFV